MNPNQLREIEEHLKKDYFLVRRDVVMAVLAVAGIGGLAGFWAAIQGAVNSQGAATATKAIEDLKAKADKDADSIVSILTSLKQRQADVAGFTPVTSTHERVTDKVEKQGVSLPAAVPETATEILVFCFASEQAEKAGLGFLLVSTTDAKGRTTTFRLYVRANPESSAFNSDYFWLPYPPNRVVSARWDQISVSTKPGGYVQVMGYR